MLQISQLPQDLVLGLVLLILCKYWQFQLIIRDGVIIIRIIRLNIHLLISQSLITRGAFKFFAWRWRNCSIVGSHVLQIQFELARLASELGGGCGALHRFNVLIAVIGGWGPGFATILRDRELLKLHSIDVAIDNWDTLFLRPSSKLAGVTTWLVIDLNVSAILRSLRYNFDCIHVEAENIWQRCARVFSLKYGRILLTIGAIIVVRAWK